MMRSMFSGVSALRSHQTQMDVIANNIANINTTGFKRGRVNFRELFNQTLRSASAPTETRGGTNPMQIGLGTGIASIDTLQVQGSLQYTGHSMDLAIEGNGFFIVSNGSSHLYTRAGLFDVDADGYLVMKGTGYRVQGWTVGDNGEIATHGPVGDLRVSFYDRIEATPTTLMHVGGNLNSEVGVGTQIPVIGNVLDSLGRSHTITLVFEKTGDNTWTFTAQIPGIPDPPPSDTIEFDQHGNWQSGEPVVMFDPGGGAQSPQTIRIDLSALTQDARPTSAEVLGHNGRPAGEFQEFVIDERGVIHRVFSNGEVRAQGQIALATFNNPAGLRKEGDTLFTRTANSGEPKIGEPGTLGRGRIAPSHLEMSNVDLSLEFTDMIISQRGFQANSRVITTSDEMLQELVNLKR